MSSQRQSTLAFKGSGWFTLVLLVAYIVYVPIHVATETHCLTGSAHVHDCCDHHHAGHDHENDHHHSADEHDLNATGKQDSQLSLLFLVADNGLIVPAPTGSVVAVVSTLDLPPDRSPDRSLPPRAPPLA